MLGQESYRILKEGFMVGGYIVGDIGGVRGIIWELTLGSSETYSYRVA